MLTRGKIIGALLVAATALALLAVSVYLSIYHLHTHTHTHEIMDLAATLPDESAPKTISAASSEDNPEKHPVANPENNPEKHPVANSEDNPAEHPVANPENNPEKHPVANSEDNPAEHPVIKPDNTDTDPAQSEALLDSSDSTFIVFVHIGIQDKPMPNIILTPNKAHPTEKIQAITSKLSSDFTTTTTLSTGARRSWIEWLRREHKFGKGPSNRHLFGTYEVFLVSDKTELHMVKSRDQLIIILRQLVRVMEPEDLSASEAVKNLIIRLGDRSPI